MTISAVLLRADEDVLRQVLDTLQEKIGTAKFSAWFRHCAQISIEADHVKVAVPNPFVANWIEMHYQTDIAQAVETHTGQAARVIVTIDPSLSGQLRQRQLDVQADIVTKANEGRSRPGPSANSAVLRHNFKSFVVGSSNKLAYTAALAVASGAAEFNPLFIHGSCGIGKTHLLQGICEFASHTSKNGRPLAWRYVTGEQFTNDFISSLRQRKLEDFRSRYRKLDLLAIDDVHFLSAKKATQDEFLHTFNSIQSAGKQIVMASDAHPRMVGEFNEQLISRFVAGMVVKVDQPDQATRMEILRRRCATMKLIVPQEALEYIATHIRGSVRELEGAIMKLTALAALEGGVITLRLASDALSDHLARTDSVLTLGDIEAVVSVFFGITVADLHSSRRTRTVSVARMICMFLARRHTRMSFPEIGRFMGKNHSSVVLAVQRLDALIAKNAELDWMTPMGEKSMPASKVLELVAQQIS
jgi:chromosomal replication initiator protein